MFASRSHQTEQLMSEIFHFTVIYYQPTKRSAMRCSVFLCVLSSALPTTQGHNLRKLRRRLEPSVQESSHKHNDQGVKSGLKNSGPYPYDVFSVRALGSEKITSTNNYETARRQKRIGALMLSDDAELDIFWERSLLDHSSASVPMSAPMATSKRTPNMRTDYPFVDPTVSPMTKRPTLSSGNPTSSPTSNQDESGLSSTPTIGSTAVSTKSLTSSNPATPKKFPTGSPTSRPTVAPTKNSTRPPKTPRPTAVPTNASTSSPTYGPTAIPRSTSRPTRLTTSHPTNSQTLSPTTTPTSGPTTRPTIRPTVTVTEPKEGSTSPRTELAINNGVDSDSTTAEACGMDAQERAVQVKQILSSVSDKTDINYDGSPQNMALQWIIHNDSRYVCPQDSEHLKQRYVMAVLYFSTEGNNWNECKAPTEFTNPVNIKSANGNCNIEAKAPRSDPTDVMRSTDAWLSPSHECSWGGLACIAKTMKMYRIEFGKLYCFSLYP